MIRRLIKSIRRKPKGVRDQIALAIAGGFTFAIFSVWLYHVPDRFSGGSIAASTEDTGSFSHLRESLGEQFANVTEAIRAESETPAETSELSESSETTVEDNQIAQAASLQLSSSTLADARAKQANNPYEPAATATVPIAATSSQASTSSTAATTTTTSVRLVTTSSSSIASTSATSTKTE